MKEIRFLLLLLVSIVGQGAWAQGIQYVQELKAGENTVDIPSFSSNYSYSTDRSAYNLYKFETPYACSFGIYSDAMPPLDKAFAIFDANGNYVENSISTMGNGYSSCSELEGHKTYYLGMRAKDANKSQTNEIYTVEFVCAQHDHVYENGMCTFEGCGKAEPIQRTLAEGWNSDVDCDYEYNPYKFIPTKSGKLNVIAKNEYDDEVNGFFYTLKDENDVVLYTNYVASAPKRKVARGEGCNVEAGTTYFLDFSQNPSGTYDILLDVEEELPPMVLDDTQSYDVTFPAGYDQTTVFQYIATQTVRLNVAVDTDAEVWDQVIMTWNEWENLQNQYESPKAKVKRKAEILFSKRVVEGETYAIIFLTNSETDAAATITLSCSELVYPEVTEGENTIDIGAVDGYCSEDTEHYNIFKYVAQKTGFAHIYTDGDKDTYGILLDSDMTFICDNDDHDNDSDFKIDRIVEEGMTYYIGVRQYHGEAIPNYKLVIDIEDFPEYEGSIVLDDSKSLEENLGEWKDKDVFTATGGVTYKRAKNKNKWGTVILPYRLYSNSKVAYYKLTAANIPNGVLEFTKIETVPANTPIAYRLLSEAGTEDQFDASVEGPVAIQVPESLGGFKLYTELLRTEDEEWYMDGWYYEDVIDTQNEDFGDEILIPDLGIMYISGDKFYHATGSVKVKPYRAIFEAYGVDWSQAKSNALRISFVDNDDYVTTIDSVIDENGEFTDVTAIYDVNGRQINNFQRGVNIIRTANGKIRKFIKK